MTQVNEILSLMREKPEGITPLDALVEVGCFRLAARISDIKGLGHIVESRMVSVPVRNGRRVRVMRYRLAA